MLGLFSFGFRNPSLEVGRDFGELSQSSLEVFDNLKLVRCPRSLDPTLVTLPSMSLVPFAPFTGDDVGIEALAARFQRLPALRREASRL